MWKLDEKLSLKLVDKKDIHFELKKKVFLGASSLDTKSFKLLGLSNKCDFEKEVTLKGIPNPITVSFHLNEPIRQKEF